MDDDRFDRFDRLGRYERYLRYLQIMDSMDMMEGICETSAGEISETPVQYLIPYKSRNQIAKMRLAASVEKTSDEEAISEDNFESNSESESSDETGETPRKKVAFDNPYRGLKDSGNPLETMSDLDFFNCYKFSKKTVYDVMELIKSGLIKMSNRGTPVPPLIELLITLKYLTNGSIQKNAMNGVSQSTISRINTRVTKLLVALQNQFIKFPDKAEADKNKLTFYEKGKFPEVVGCIGSTHVGVRVKGIKDYNVGFVNENGYHSVRVQIHQLMLEDKERMLSYKNAIMNNKKYIEGKTVMDVGAGSGILSIFCAMAGAKKVYAVEASNLAVIARNVIKDNNLENTIEVIHSMVEDVKLPNNEKVDMIVSEWMGFYLLHEGMLDSVFFARDNFLKNEGSMFPESTTIYMAPCSVPSLYDFWEDVHGVNMKSVGSMIRKDKSSKPEVIQIEEKDLLAEKTALAWIDLNSDTTSDLDCYTMKHILGASRDGRYQGLCIWFECVFPSLCDDGEEPVTLCTAPWSPPTHWKQTVIVLPEEHEVEKGDPIAWDLSMKRSEESSRRYTLQLTLLDPMTEQHPSPCTCHMTKCIVIRTFLEQHPDGENF